MSVIPALNFQLLYFVKLTNKAAISRPQNTKFYVWKIKFKREVSSVFC
jgi:hypothetical protein